MEENNGLNMRNWGYYEPSHKGHLGLQLMSSVAERNTKSIPSGRESTVMVTANGDFHHRDCGVPQSSVPMDYMRDSWINHREKFLHLLSGNQNFTVLSEQPETHALQILQPPDSPKDEKMTQMEEAGSKNDGPPKKRRGGRSPKEPKTKKAKRVPVAPKGEGKPGKKTSGVSINGMGIDISDIPIPICSCTGAPQQCYRWGCGGWQSACCTRSMSLYPLPTSTKRRGARIAGRKMSQGAFSKVLERLVAEGYNLSNPIDLRTHWAKHGTNKFVTIR